MDDLLGTPGLIEWSHRFFEQAFFYLSSNLSPPEYLKAKTQAESKLKDIFEEIIFASEVSWRGQGGGSEGLRRKGWTAIISAALLW